MLDVLPKTVRYVKNGRGGQWWATAKTRGEIHLGWRTIPSAPLQANDRDAIKALIQTEFGAKKGATQDFNALQCALVHPSQHVWVTFEDGCMWWCTVRDGIETNADGEAADKGHFWLTCDRPWSDKSVGRKHLVIANLPGKITKTQGFQGTICEPQAWREMLRIIRDEEDSDAVAATHARDAYEGAVAKLVARLGPKDFELLIDLILARYGWVRLAKLGGVTEGIDIEAENAVANEVAFVQIKSEAGQGVLDDYVERFNGRRERYDRMIFAVHTPLGTLSPPSGQPVQVWAGDRIAKLVV
jgi:hypothetical protein